MHKSNDLLMGQNSWDEVYDNELMCIIYTPEDKKNKLEDELQVFLNKK